MSKLSFDSDRSGEKPKGLLLRTHVMRNLLEDEGKEARLLNQHTEAFRTYFPFSVCTL